MAKNIKSRVFHNKEILLVGVAKGVSGLCRAAAWLKDSAAAAWVPRSMCSSQFTRDFKAVLLEHALGVPEPYGSHSCNAPVLSGLAKFGISHHTTCQERSSGATSQDKMFRPLRTLEMSWQQHYWS
eukprot:2227597-Amphidinium_carterae.1